MHVYAAWQPEMIHRPVPTETAFTSISGMNDACGPAHGTLGGGMPTFSGMEVWSIRLRSARTRGLSVGSDQHLYRSAQRAASVHHMLEGTQRGVVRDSVYRFFFDGENVGEKQKCKL